MQGAGISDALRKIAALFPPGIDDMIEDNIDWDPFSVS
jgi:hypothetical protein